MKQIFAAAFILVVVISLIFIAFTINQTEKEEARLKTDLENRSMLLAESLKETIEPNFINNSPQYLQRVVEKFANRERFAGLAIYDNKGQIMAVSGSGPKELSQSQKIAADAMDADKAVGKFVQLKDRKMYLLAMPIHDEQSVVGAFTIAQNALYIEGRLAEIWRNNLLRLFVQTSLLSIATLLLVRWILYEPIRGMVESLRLARTGDMQQHGQNLPGSFFFKPLIQEISHVRRSLMEARMTASQEASLRLEKFDFPWTAQRLKEFIKDAVNGRAIFVVSNREPYIHVKNGGNITYYVPASGMVTAIEPVMQACGGMWIAHGSGSADKLVVENDRLGVPPEEPKYTLRRVWLTEQEEPGYYDGFSNSGLWPLFHIAHTRPIFKKEDWEDYKKVNGKFAQIVLSEIKDLERPIILVQDFHLALLPEMIKNSRPDAAVGIFWHVPWPNPESFSICPWKKEILDGILGADLIGFHTQLYCNNFIETVGRELESLIDFEQFTVTRDNHTSLIKPFPVSIAFPDGATGLTRFGVKERKIVLKNLDIKTSYIGVGVDRLDYTKGILERIKAIEIFLKKYPFYQGNFTFMQLAVPTRSKVKRYQDFAREVEKEIERVNALFKKRDWKPIVLYKKYHSREEIYKAYRVANFCLVTSLHDGMNLVAKEFVAARDDRKGVLILSQFTGASKELKDALIVNPYNAEETAEAIKEALEMPVSDQTKRMKRMRDIVKSYNVYRWSAEVLKTMAALG